MNHRSHRLLSITRVDTAVPFSRRVHGMTEETGRRATASPLSSRESPSAVRVDHNQLAYGAKWPAVSGRPWTGSPCPVVTASEWEPPRGGPSCQRFRLVPAGR